MLPQGAVTPLVLKCMSKVGVDTQPLPSEPNPDDGPHMELTRDVWDLDDDQLWEMLEALQMETARRKGAALPHRSL